MEVKQGNRTFLKSITWEKLQDPLSLLLKADTQKIYDLLRESVARVFRDQGKAKRLFQQHYRIFNAIKNRSPEKASERVLEHLNCVEPEVKALANQGGPSWDGG